MSALVVVGLFDSPGAAAAAAKALAALPQPPEEVTTISGVPLPDGAVVRDPRPVRFPRFAIALWFAGAAAGTALAVATYVLYPLVTAGKPIVSVPPTFIVTYEVAMLGALVGTLVFGFREMGLLRFRRRRIHDARIHEGKIASLRRFKDDVSEVKSGFECGIGFEGYSDVKVGDIIEAYTIEKIQPTSL